MKNLLITKVGIALSQHLYENKEERLALYRYVLNVACSCTLIALLLLVPELDVAFSWMKG